MPRSCLPNIAWLSDAQCRQIRDYAARGGSVMASFETAMYDENGRRRENSGLAELFGIDSVGVVAPPNGNGFYARIERPHEILNGFEDTNWIPGGAYRLPIKAAGAMPLSVVPAYTAYPPELSYNPLPETGEPAAIVRENGDSRLLYFSGDVERAAWRSGQTDLARLLQNSVDWLVRGTRPVSVEGEGVIECFAWETVPGYAVHLLNYNNPNMHRGWLRRHYRLGEQRVRLQVPAGTSVARVELLRAERKIEFARNGNAVEFTVPGIDDYEVAAIYTFCGGPAGRPARTRRLGRGRPFGPWRSYLPVGVGVGVGCGRHRRPGMLVGTGVTTADVVGVGVTLVLASELFRLQPVNGRQASAARDAGHAGRGGVDRLFIIGILMTIRFLHRAGVGGIKQGSGRLCQLRPATLFRLRLRDRP